MTDKQKYVNVSMTRDSAAALRDHAAKHNIMIRDAALDMARTLENREALLFETDDALKTAWDKLAASEEAQQVALEQAEQHRLNAHQYQVAARDWKIHAERQEQRVTELNAEVNDLSRRLTEATATIDELKGELSAADAIISRQGVALLNQQHKRLSVEAMTAWDHVRAAVGKEPGIAWVPVLGLLAIAAAAVIRGMI